MLVSLNNIDFKNRWRSGIKFPSQLFHLLTSPLQDFRLTRSYNVVASKQERHPDLVEASGFEPELSEPKSEVLPLHHASKW